MVGAGNSWTLDGGRVVPWDPGWMEGGKDSMGVWMEGGDTPWDPGKGRINLPLINDIGTGGWGQVGPWCRWLHVHGKSIVKTV